MISTPRVKTSEHHQSPPYEVLLFRRWYQLKGPLSCRNFRKSVVLVYYSGRTYIVCKKVRIISFDFNCEYLKRYTVYYIIRKMYLLIYIHPFLPNLTKISIKVIIFLIISNNFLSLETNVQTFTHRTVLKLKSVCQTCVYL